VGNRVNNVLSEDPAVVPARSGEVDSMRAVRKHPRSHRGQPSRPARWTVRWFNFATIALLVAGLLANFAVATPISAQQENNTPPPFPAPNAVVAAGSFQTAVGCGQDWDKDCGLTDLQPNEFGVWTGTFQIPAGYYTFRIVTRADIDRSFGEDGDPEGGDISLDVPDGALGVFFSYNQWTSEIYAAPVLNQVELSTDLGQFPMSPNDDGGYFAVIDADPGAQFGAQVIMDGNPVGDIASVDAGSGGRVIVTLEENGNLESEAVEPAVLTVAKTDGDGNPLPGACFSAYDGNDLVGQGCDVSDGDDGQTRIEFPFGAEGRLDLRESRTPEGQETAEAQDIELDPGENQATATVGGGPGEPTEEPTDEEPTEAVPTDETVTVDFVMVDEAGNPVSGGCLSLEGVGEQCDDDGDAVIRFENVQPNQSYNLSEPSAPEGYEQFDGASIDVGDTDVQFNVPHSQAVTEPETGTLILFTVDENGNPIPGVCYEVTSFDEAQCDEDGDGDMGLTDIPAGDYGARQDSVPDGYQLDEQEQSVTVEAGEEVSLTFTSPTEQAETHTVNVSVSDQDGNPVGGACFAVSDSSGEVCDDDQEATVQFELTDGDYTLTMSTTPEGFETPGEQPFTVQGEDLDLQVQLTPTEEPAADNGAIDVAVTDPDGFAIIGACVEISGPVSGEICDNGDGDANGEDGLIRIENLPDGDYIVSVTQLPEGFEPAEPTNVNISGGATADAFLISGAVPAEPTPTQAPDTGNLLIRKFDPDRESLAGACFNLIDANGNSIDVCDNGDGDSDDRDGRIRVDDLAPGDWTVTETQAPDGYSGDEPQTITIIAGETARVNFTNELALGTVVVSTTDGASAIGGTCYELSGIGQQCDDDGDGALQFDAVPPGDYTVTQISVPEGYSASDPVDQTVTVNAGESTQVDFVVSLAQGSLSVTVVDEEGNAVAGACIAVNDGTPVCDDDSDGQIQFDGLTPGDVTVTMSTTPEGYTDGGSTTATIQAGQTAGVTFTLSVANGRIDIVTENAAGDRLGGACYSINGGEPICDNAQGDANDNDGVIRVGNLPPGEYSVSQTTAPPGHDQAADQAFQVNPGARTRVDVVNEPLAGSIQVAIADEVDGAPISGACITSDGFSGEICDNGEGDANGDEGVIRVDGVVPGTYTVTISTAPEGYGAVESGGVQATVESGGLAEVTLQVARLRGNLAIAITDADGNPVAGVCVTVTGPGGDSIDVCDNGDNDADGAESAITVQGLLPGDYTIAVTSAPEGYQIPEIAATASVPAGGDASTSLQVALVPPTETATEVPTETETATEVPTETETATAVPTDTETATEIPAETETEVPTEEPAATDTPTEEVIVLPPEDQTATAEAGAETPTEEVATGSIRITVTDTDGNALVGACFAVASDTASSDVCDNDDGDLEGAEGIVEISNLPAGEYNVSQTQAPEGFSAAVDQTVTIPEDGGTVELTFVNEETPVETGNLQITSTDQDGNAVGGACYQISTTEACDNQAGDANNTPGVVLIEAIPVGEYAVSETQAPEGFDAAGDQTVTIEVDATAELTYEHEAAEPETGAVSMTLQDQDGDPAEGACILLSSEENDIIDQQYCDNGEGDENPEPAQLEVANLPVGSYSAEQVQADEPGEDEVLTTASFDQSTFTVQANATIIVIVIIIIEPPAVGDLQITKRAADTNALQTGACFRITGEGNEIEVCDNDDVDLNGSNGIVRLEDLSAGDYLIEEITAPPGYQLAPDQNTTVPNGGTRSVLIKDQPVEDTTGGLIVHKIDPEGNLLPGACFQLRDEGVAIVTVCDDDDGDNDGRTTFVDVEVENYLLRETTTPSGDYLKGPDTVVNIFGGVDDQVVEIVNTLKPGTLRITKVAEDGTTLLGGACFGLERGSGIEYEACDNAAGDVSGTVGRIQIVNLPPDSWNLIETVPPSGYDPAADEAITINPGETLSITIQNEPTPPSADKGTVVINKLADGDLVGGACFALKQGAVTKYATCDGANNDGLIEFPSVTVGNYTVHETKAPNPTSWYIIGADQDISVTKDETTEVDVTNTLKPGRILVIKKNTSGNLLQNACFRIAPDPNDAGQKCTNATGQVSFDNLPTTQTYKLTETKAPNGYEKAKDVSNISLTPGLTTTVNVIDKKAPPPPTDGSVLVIKFFCPAGKAGEITSYLDSSDPGPEKLVQTTGCTKGDARLSLVPKAGGTGLEFNTGADGEYFTTLAKGTWEIREITPQESDAEDVLIYAGQQTTVVVIDYVEPPAPKPATVNVIKYTCAPGFGGVYYADFLNNCTADSELTNNVSFRTSGPTVAKRITGAAGQPGRASFTQLKAGDYTLIEDVPSTAVSVYAFCGYDVYNWADWYSATGSVFLPLRAGDTVTCIWFNVPDDLSDSTGAIVVHKYACNGRNFPAGYDYFANCPAETDGIKFAISLKQGNQFVPRTTAITNQNGLISFGRLKPGTYNLKEVGGDWCHAKSDSVDAQGNLIVRAGQRTNVWIFNCVPTKQPPNTGAGPMAGVIGGGAVSGAGAVLAGFAWPVIGLAGFRVRRKLRRAT
jgi:uncharacterized surface anchored protein